MDQGIENERAMMKPLRKRHLQIWIALMVLLPGGIVLAWLAIPNSEPVKLLQTSSIDLLPIIKSTNDKRSYTVNLRTGNDNTQWQLEWKNKLPLTVASAVIYKASPSPSKGVVVGSFKTENAELIGRIEARGDYGFPIPADSTGNKQFHFVLYDFIHQQVIDSINFHL